MRTTPGSGVVLLLFNRNLILKFVYHKRSQRSARRDFGLDSVPGFSGFFIPGEEIISKIVRQ